MRMAQCAHESAQCKQKVCLWVVDSLDEFSSRQPRRLDRCGSKTFNTHHHNNTHHHFHAPFGHRLSFVTMSRQGRNSIADMGLVRVRALVDDTRNRRSRDGNNGMGCLLFTGSVNNDGYGQVSGKAVLANNKDHMYSLHRLVGAAVTGVDIPVGFHASHLCDVRRCFHRSHIVVESIAANNGRKGCIGSIVCNEHAHVLWACSHQPACIRVPAVVQTCCLKVEQARRAGNTVDAGQQMSQPGVDDFTAASLAAENQPIGDAIRTYADVVRTRSASRQSSVQPSSSQDRAGSALTPAQREAHHRTGFDPSAW